MMPAESKTYYLRLNVSPTKDNVRQKGVTDLMAHVFVVDNSVEEALDVAREYCSVYNFHVDSIEVQPTVLSIEQASHSNIGLKCFQRAQRDKVYALIVGSADPPMDDDMIEILRLRP